MLDAQKLASMIEDAMARNPERVASDEAINIFVRTVGGDGVREDLLRSA